MHTAIITINWNGAQDTINCIQSVLNLPHTRIIVWDNCSSDDSVAVIRTWLLANEVSFDCFPSTDNTGIIRSNAKVNLVTCDANLGFAKATNRVLEQLIRSGKWQYAWLLNNDAVATDDALAAMQRAMDKQPDCAFAGSVILDFNNPDLVQCCGVRYYKYFGVSKLQFKDSHWHSLDKNAVAHNHTDFQNGASLLIRLSALQKIGLMDERFFLYSEEHDWQHTALEMGFKNTLVVDSIVLHKGSMSTNSSKYLFFYYYNKSCVLFSRKHFSPLTTFIATFLLTGITMLRTRMQARSLVWGFKGIFEGWF